MAGLTAVRLLTDVAYILLEKGYFNVGLGCAHGMQAELEIHMSYATRAGKHNFHQMFVPCVVGTGNTPKIEGYEFIKIHSSHGDRGIRASAPE